MATAWKHCACSVDSPVPAPQAQHTSALRTNVGERGPGIPIEPCWGAAKDSDSREHSLIRLPVILRSAIMILTIASPAILLAQFQQPTADELQMTADPKAPGAAAVFF